MKQPIFKGREPLPDSVIDAACAGDSEAMELVLLYYDGIHKQAVYPDAL